MLEAGGGNLKNLTCGGKESKQEAEVIGMNDKTLVVLQLYSTL
jgi:hypothetical protein